MRRRTRTGKHHATLFLCGKTVDHPVVPVEAQRLAELTVQLGTSQTADESKPLQKKIKDNILDIHVQSLPPKWTQPNRDAVGNKCYYSSAQKNINHVNRAHTHSVICEHNSASPGSLIRTCHLSFKTCDTSNHKYITMHYKAVELTKLKEAALRTRLKTVTLRLRQSTKQKT